MISTLTIAALSITATLGQDAPAAPAAPLAPTTAIAPVLAAHSGLAVVPARLDLGAVERGTSVRSHVWLVNTSLQPITVEKAKAGCGCTTLYFTAMTLAPGAAEQVWFDIKTPFSLKNVTLSNR